MNLFDLAFSVKGFPIAAAKAQLAEIQQMGTDEFVAWQQKKAWSIARFHYDNNDLYRSKVGRIFPSAWEDLPVITKQDFQRPLGQVITKGVKQKNCYIGSTSGATGVPFFFAKDKLAHAMTWAVIADRYQQYGLDSGAKQARFYGIPKEFAGYWTERLKDVVMNRRRFSVFNMSDEAMRQYLQQFSNAAFTYIYGYTSALVLFARYVIAQGLVLNKVCASLKFCISTSEVCTPEDHELLSHAFGVPHIREYGVSETCLTAFDMPGNSWRLTEETLFTEVVDECSCQVAFGRSGEILSTSLFNTAFPMVRYQIGDVGVLGERQGSIYRTLHALQGRSNDVIKLPGNRTAAGLTFYYISRSILESTGVLKEFIIRQVSLAHFIFDIVADRALTEEEVRQIQDKMDVYLQPGLKLTINRVGSILRPASGKLKHFYSELD